MKPTIWLRHVAAATLFVFFSLGIQAQKSCDFSDDFSSPSGWTQVGDLVTIQTGVVAYQNGAPGAEQRRVYKNIGTSLTASDTWAADIDFTPVSVGDYNGPHAGHAILSLTAGTQEPFSNCPDPPQCSGYPLSQQDGIVCMFGSPGNPSDGNSYFMVFAIEGTDGSEYMSTPIMANALGVPYFVRLERVSPTMVWLNVFSDAAKTVHLPGSPVALTIPASIEGLTTVQHGNIARGGWYRELTGEVDNLCINWDRGVDPSCDFSDDFSSPSGWTQVGDLVTIQTGVVAYQNGAPDGDQRRVYKNIGVSLTASDTWAADIDFAPVSVGDYNGPHAGHAILSLTAGTQEPFSNCPDPPQCSGYPLSQQDGIVCMFGSPGNPSDGNSYFMVFAIEGTTGSEYVSTPILANALGVPYFVRLERLSPTLVRLNVFSDAAKTVHLPGSPVALTIPASIEGLNTVQHGNIARGGWYRELTGEVDNLCINWDRGDACPPDRTLAASEGSTININTGLDEALNPLPFGAVDPRWTIVSSTLPPMRALDRWNFPLAASQWIGFDNNQGTEETNYQVRFTFCTEACGDYRLQFNMLADNSACVYLDGVPVPSNWALTNVPIPDCSFTPGDQSPFIPTEGYLISHTAALSSGMHTLEIDVTNFGGSLSSINVLGSIGFARACAPLSTNGAPAQTEQLRLFPNPAQDEMTVAWENGTPQNLRIYDVMGRSIRSMEVLPETKQLEILLTGLQPGSYFLTYQDDTGRTHSQRFVKI